MTRLVTRLCHASLDAFSPDLDVVWVRALADSPLARRIGWTPRIALIPENPELIRVLSSVPAPVIKVTVV